MVLVDDRCREGLGLVSGMGIRLLGRYDGTYSCSRLEGVANGKNDEKRKHFQPKRSTLMDLMAG